MFTILRNIEAASTEIMPMENMSSRENLRLADLRSDRRVPGAAIVDRIACARVPSGSRASTYGDASSKPRN